MKKPFFLLFCIAYVGTAQFDITFDAEDARLSFGFAAALNYDPRNPVSFERGIIRCNRSSLFTGKELSISSLIVEELPGVYARLQSVTYDPRVQREEYGTAPSISFDGYGRIDAVGGFNLYELVVNGTNNAINGAPTFNDMVCLGEGAELTLGLTVPLSVGIHLNGGTVYTTTDLVFEDGAFFHGTGTVSAGSSAIKLDDYYLTHLCANITWDSCKNIQLRGHAPISGDWTFVGDCFVQGDNSWIDLRQGGRLIIAPDSSLVLRDVVLKGVTDGGSLNIVFAEPSGEQSYGTISFDGCRVEFFSSFALSNGTVKIEGDSVFVLRDFDVVFQDNARLMLNDASLFLNVLSNDAAPYNGTVYAPYAVYNANHEKQVSAIQSNIVAGNLVICGASVISEISSVTAVFNASNDGGTPVDINSGGLVAPAAAFNYFTDTVVDGTGSIVTFANSSTPQFNVADGARVRLQNITLQGITNSTFNLGVDAVIEIGENVVFTLAENIIWSREKLVLVDQGNTFEIRGIGSQRMLYFHSDGIGDPNNLTYETHFELGLNTLLLNNAILKGLRHITFDSQDGIVGGIVLRGDSVVEIELGEYVVRHFFEIEGLNNIIRLRSDNVSFQNQITFDPVLHSSLTFSFVFPDGTAPIPTVHFADEALTISSEVGVAYCTFDAAAVNLCNEAVNSIRLGNNSCLKGNRMTVFLNPIEQTSSRATVFPGLQLISDLPDGALVLSDGLLNSMRGPGKRYSMRQVSKQYDLFKRGVSLPNENVTPVLRYDSSIALPQLAGNIILRELFGQVYTNMRISNAQNLNVSLYNGVRMEQAVTVPTVLKENDIVNALGGTVQAPNAIALYQDFTVNGSLMLDDNAVLCIEGVSLGAPSVLTFGPASQISFGQNSHLIIRGNVSVVFPDGYVIPFANTGSTFTIGKDTIVTLSGEKEVTVSGTGTLQYQDGGRLYVSNGASLTIGTQLSDNITLRAKTGGNILIGNAVSGLSAQSYLSFAGSYCALDCSQGGGVCIARNGNLEFNMYHGTTRNGVLNRIDFSNGGSFYVGQQGAVSIYNNVSGSGINLMLYGGTVGGSGTVGFAASGFRGTIQSSVYSDSNVSGIALVRNFIQTNAALLEATVFLNGATSVLRTVNGALVTLGASQIIINDDAATHIVYGYNGLTGRKFSYDADGVLR